MLITAPFVTALQAAVAERSVVDCRLSAVADVGHESRNPADNAANLLATYLEELQALPWAGT